MKRLRANVVVRVDGVDVGIEAGVAERAAEPGACAIRSRRVRRTSTGTGGPRSRLRRVPGGRSGFDLREAALRASCTRASRCSMRSAAAMPTDVVAHPSARICSVRWCTAKNTALRTTFLAATDAAVAASRSAPAPECSSAPRAARSRRVCRRARRYATRSGPLDRSLARRTPTGSRDAPRSRAPRPRSR